MPDEHWIFAPPPENGIRQMQDFGPILCINRSLFYDLYIFKLKTHGFSGSKTNKKENRQ